MPKKLSAKITILGSGTSTGVPVIGCTCSVCKSDNPRNKRLRTSIMLTRKDDGRHIVVDTTPDFRGQMLSAGVSSLAAVLFTHTHADHLNGFDDLRPFFFFSKKAVPCFISKHHVGDLRRRFFYAFEDTGYMGTRPQVDLFEFADEPFVAADLQVDPAKVPHGGDYTYAFRIGSFVYATDFKQFPDALIDRWKGRVKTMVATGLRFEDHPTHSSIGETIDLFAKLGVEKGVLIHMTHNIDHDRDSAKLPPHVSFAYDGMEFDTEL